MGGLVKFGDFFAASLSLYRIILINPYDLFVRPESSRLRQTFAFLSFWFFLVSCGVVTLQQIAYLLALIQRTEDIVQIIASAGWIPTSLMAFEGLVFTYRHRRRVVRLLVALESSFPKTRGDQEFASVRETYDNWTRMSWIVCRAYKFAMLVIMFQNISLAVVWYFLLDEWSLKMPRLLWYPFDPTNASLAHQLLIYAFECWGSIVTTRAVVPTGLFLGSITMHVCIQFDSLTRQFRELRPTRETLNADCAKLIELVQRHNYLIKICNELGDIYRVSLLLNYVLSSMVIGFFGFLILNEPVMSQKTEYFFDFTCFMLYNSLFSFYGDRLTARSRGIAETIFCSNWLHAHLKYKKDLLFVMTRAGKPFVLSGYFFVVSYETYKKILTTSYSYLALLLATYRKQR